MTVMIAVALLGFLRVAIIFWARFLILICPRLIDLAGNDFFGA